MQELPKRLDFRDEQDDHLEADMLLLHYIDDKEVEEAFIGIKKWYT